MVSPIVNPEIPYNGEVPGGLEPGKMIRIQGVTHPDSDRFNINLQTGPSSSPRDDTALHISVRLNQGYIARNTYKNGSWGDEQGDGTLFINQAQSFEIIVLVDPSHYKIAVNGQHFCEFPHRIPFQQVSHLLINGDVSITLISFEGAAPSAPPAGGEVSSQSSQLNAAVPPQYGPGPGGYGPPPNYGPQGYGPPPQGYGPPPPPGAQQESGFDGFLEQAQDILAGAIKSGAAEKLLSSIMSSGGGNQPHQSQGYAPQNARYGIYPELPREDTPVKPPNSGSGSAVQQILSGLLSGGSNQQTNSSVRNEPQQNQGGGSGPIENLLSGLLSGGGNQQNYQNQHTPQQPYVPPNPQHNDATQDGAGPITTLLTGLLSGGSNQQSHGTQQPNAPQFQPNVPPQQSSEPPQYGNPNQQNHVPGPLENLLTGLLSGTNKPPPQQYPSSSPSASQQYQPNNPPQQQNHPNVSPQEQNEPHIPPQQQTVPVSPPVQPQLPIGNPSNLPSSHESNLHGGNANQPTHQYGQYPHGPPQQEQKGPVESLLSGLLSGGGGQQQQQPHIPQVGGNSSIGGLGSMGSILSSLAGQILHNPGNGNQRQNY